MLGSRSAFILVLLFTASVLSTPLWRTTELGAQQPAGPDANADGPTELQIHRTRALIAWKRAAWQATPASLNESIGHLERARAAAGQQRDNTVDFLLGYAYLLQGRTNEGNPLLNAVRDAAPSYVGFGLTDGMVHEDFERHADAVTALDGFLARRDEIAQNPQVAQEFEFLGLIHRGQSLLGHGKVDRAIADFEAALELSATASGTESAAAKVLLARAHVQAEQFSVAEALLLEVVAADPGEGSNYYHLGVIYADQQKLEQARHWYALAIQHQPGFARVYIKLAYVAKALDDLRGCRRYLETYAALTFGDGSTPRTTDQTADVEAGFGQYWEAVGNARRDFGNDAGADKAFDAAIDHFRNAVEARPDCMAAISKLIQLLFRRNGADAELKTLKEQLQELKKLRPDGADVARSTFC